MQYCYKKTNGEPMILCSYSYCYFDNKTRRVRWVCTISDKEKFVKIGPISDRVVYALKNCQEQNNM